MNFMKIIAFSAGRSDIDRYDPFLNCLQKQNSVKLSIVNSNIHYLKLFGNTNQIKKNLFNIEKKTKKKVFDNALSISQNLSEEIKYFSKIIFKRKPNLILVLGDRYEMLAPVVSSIPFNVPVVHLYGGAVTVGAIDELVRHAITKMSHIHLTAHEKYTKRIIKLGEEKWRIKTIGMPDLKLLKDQKKININMLSKIIKLDLTKQTMLVTLHPTVLIDIKIKKQVENLLNAIKQTNFQAIFTYPNSDLGHEIIIKKIKKFCEKNKKYKFVKFLPKNVYSNLLRSCCCMVGNSSGGIVEAASFKLPVVNLGNRQDGKIKSKNVINCDFSEKKITQSIFKSTSKNFILSLRNLKNTYESKINIKKICNFIIKQSLKKNILLKKFK